MYVRVFWGRVRLGMWDDFVRHYNEKVAPVSEDMKGFRGRRLMQSTENPDEGASISLWETLEDMGNYERSPNASAPLWMHKIFMQESIGSSILKPTPGSRRMGLQYGPVRLGSRQGIQKHR